MDIDANELILVTLPPVSRDIAYVIDPLVDDKGRAKSLYTGEVIPD